MGTNRSIFTDRKDDIIPPSSSHRPAETKSLSLEQYSFFPGPEEDINKPIRTVETKRTTQDGITLQSVQLTRETKQSDLSEVKKVTPKLTHETYSIETYDAVGFSAFLRYRKQLKENERVIFCKKLDNYVVAYSIENNNDEKTGKSCLVNYAWIVERPSYSALRLPLGSEKLFDIEMVNSETVKVKTKTRVRKFKLDWIDLAYQDITHVKSKDISPRIQAKVQISETEDFVAKVYLDNQSKAALVGFYKNGILTQRVSLEASNKKTSHLNLTIEIARLSIDNQYLMVLGSKISKDNQYLMVLGSKISNDNQYLMVLGSKISNINEKVYHASVIHLATFQIVSIPDLKVPNPKTVSKIQMIGDLFFLQSDNRIFKMDFANGTYSKFYPIYPDKNYSFSYENYQYENFYQKLLNYGDALQPFAALDRNASDEKQKQVMQKVPDPKPFKHIFDNFEQLPCTLHDDKGTKERVFIAKDKDELYGKEAAGYTTTIFTNSGHLRRIQIDEKHVADIYANQVILGEVRGDKINAIGKFDFKFDYEHARLHSAKLSFCKNFLMMVHLPYNDDRFYHDTRNYITVFNIPMQRMLSFLHYYDLSKLFYFQMIGENTLVLVNHKSEYAELYNLEQDFNFISNAARGQLNYGLRYPVKHLADLFYCYRDYSLYLKPLGIPLPTQMKAVEKPVQEEDQALVVPKGSTQGSSCFWKAIRWLCPVNGPQEAKRNTAKLTS